jgi:hypothetical protein
VNDDLEITPEELAAHEAEQREHEEAEERELLDAGGLTPEMEASLDALESFRDFGLDLQAVDTDSPIRWLPGAEGIMRRAERASWVAKQGEGKTQAAVQFAAQVCEAGGRVMYLDVENDEREMAERFKSLGMDADAWSRLVYINDTVAIRKMHTEQEVTELWARALRPAVDLLIYDSMTRVLASLDYDENANKDIADWMAAIVDPIRGAGVSVLILDNTGHDDSRARGAINKTALIETSFSVKGGKEVSGEQHGLITLKLERSRSGKIAKHVKARSGGSDYGPLEVAEGDAPKAGKVGADQESRRMAMRMKFNDLDGYASMKTLREWFPGNADNTLRADVKSLSDVEPWDKKQGPSPGRGDHWRLKR